jgi:NAD(P)-dependent dehydrogenase (short-subunit alcohol dehydrogenase family)
MLVCKSVLPAMLAQRRGVIINIASSAGLTGNFGYPAYAASKAALGALTRHIATTYGDRGVRCNAVAPGFIATPKMATTDTSRFAEIIIEGCPIPRAGTSRDIGDMVAFLSSDRAAYVTGQTISVDGGQLIHHPATGAMRRMATERDHG